MVGRLDLDIHLLLKVNPDTHELLQEEDGSFHLCHPGDVGMLLNVIENPESYKLYTSEHATKKKILKGIKLSGVENNENIGSKAYLKSGDLFLLHENNWVSFADRLGDTFRWMGENVSTQEVENIIATHKDISLAGVYGVSIPNTDGRAGMAAIVVEQTTKFDISDFLEFLNASLPKYAIPLFLRVCENLDLTGSYKIKKVKLRTEGYDITKINDKIFYLDPDQKKYIVLDEKKYNQILNGI
jgi:acyl-CoA synthetase (AMP-forming)/AMP-acid ligase II